MTHYSSQAFAELLASLKDGDRPLDSGDVVETPWGTLTVSKVYGWGNSHQMVEEDGRYRFVPVRTLKVSFFEGGAKRATVRYLVPEATAEVEA